MSLLVAIITASLLAVFGFPVKFYQCWFSWSRWATSAGLLLYFVLAGGGGGLVGWGAAVLTKAVPTDNVPLNGFIYGVAGALALRADVGARPRSTRSDAFRDAKSILTTSINWTVELLDRVTYKRALAWLSGLSDDDLLLETYRLNAEITSLPAKEMSNAAKKEHLTRLVPKMESLAEGGLDANEIRAIRAHLVSFCAQVYKGDHLMKLSQSQEVAISVTNK
jgi:hypothetical protein